MYAFPLAAFLRPSSMSHALLESERTLPNLQDLGAKNPGQYHDEPLLARIEESISEHATPVEGAHHL